jgi:hypothetical protein
MDNCVQKPVLNHSDLSFGYSNLFRSDNKLSSFEHCVNCFADLSSAADQTPF